MQPATAPLPPNGPNIRIVGSFEELLGTPFRDGVNALCWPRTLPGDFGEVVRRLEVGPGITTIEEARLASLPVSEAGRVAIAILREDLRLLREQGLLPVLDCVNGYAPADDPGVIRTDVQSFHVDSATAEADTWLCTYYGPSSEGLRNDQAQRRVDVPETRERLLRDFGGEDDEAFREYLNENCYDLHYVPTAGAIPYSFGLGNLWRIAVEYPGSPVRPCIHRAPATIPGMPPRLLLLS